MLTGMPASEPGVDRILSGVLQQPVRRNPPLGQALPPLRRHFDRRLVHRFVLPSALVGVYPGLEVLGARSGNAGAGW